MDCRSEPLLDSACQRLQKRQQLSLFFFGEPQPDAGQWIMRCFECGAKNIITVVPRRRRLPVLSIAWVEGLT